MPDPLHVLHLVGATTTRFYFDLSRTYHAAVAMPPGTIAQVWEIRPDGAMTWRTPDGAPEPVDLSTAAARAGGTDVCVPHMFCPPGMTTWRAFLSDVVGLPVVGPDAACLHAGTSKWTTKALARAAHVATPDAAPLAPDTPCPTLPVIVKPVDEDNSIGLSLVADPAAWPAARSRALAATGRAMVETYVPGREVRVGVIADPVPRVLPVLEYHVTPDHPIRVRADKVATDVAGAVTTASWDRPSLPTTCPARLADVPRAAVERAALAMHDALGARDYSLFDLRIDAAGRPWLLEACIFWSFARFSVLTRMVEAEGGTLDDAALRLWRQAARRRSAAPLAAE